MGSIIGGPVAKRLIDKHNLKTSIKESTTSGSQSTKEFESNLFRSVMLVILTVL